MKFCRNCWISLKTPQLKPLKLRNALLLSKDKSDETAWNKAEECGHLENFQKLFVWPKKLQLKPEDFRNELLLSRDRLDKRAGTKQQKDAKLNN